MNNYSIISPSLDGVLSDDYIYFEGARRPTALFALRDGGIIEEKDVIALEQYFNDMYNLFLRKLTTFAGSAQIDDQETLKLQALLQELVKVKKLIENSPKTD